MRTNMRQGAPAPTQAPAPAARTKRMTLDAVTSGVVKEPRRIFIYGDGGLGKSTFFADAGNTIFFDTQGGTENIAGANRFPTPTCWEDLLDACDELLAKPPKYSMLAIDLIDDVEQFLWNYICKRDGKKNIEDYGFFKGQNTISLVEWRVLLARLERLRREKRMAIGIAGHAAVCKFKNPEGEDYGKFGPAINEKASGLIRGWCDTVLYAKLDSFERVNDKTGRARGVSTGDRIMYTVGTAAYYAKNRDGLPDRMALDWAEYAAAVEAGTPASPEELRAMIDGLLAQVTDEKLIAGVTASLAEVGQDPTKLARVLNRLRERLQPQDNEQAPEANGEAQ